MENTTKEPQADNKPATTTEGRIVPRSVKHMFTQAENLDMNTRLLNALDSKDNTEMDFEAVKADHKTKLAAADALVGSLRSSLRTGFEMRVKDCRCVYRPKEKKKDFFLLNPDGSNGELVATEDMTGEDMQMELIQAEAKFERREEITLWDEGNDKGIIVVGRLDGRWYCALRLRVGQCILQERLDSLQKSVKERFPAVKGGATRAVEWLESNLPKDAQGFKEPILNAIEPHKERAE